MHKYIFQLVQRIIDKYKFILFWILKMKILNIIEVKHLSYPFVNLWINYACIKSDQTIGIESDQAIRPELQMPRYNNKNII